VKQDIRTRKRSRRAARPYARLTAPTAAKVDGSALPFTERLALRSLRGLPIPSSQGALQPRWIVTAAFVLVFGTLLFWNLGQGYLWDDEANTALFGESVWRTGHPSAVAGENIIAFREGLELQGLENRRIPPLAYYIEAPFIGLLGRSPFAARLPFALVGLLGLLLVLYWLRKDNAGLRTWILVGLGACGNVSLILYTRQARYYALAAFLTLLVTYLYLHHNGCRRTLIALCISSLALLSTSYLAYGALVACLGVDYLVFERHRKAFYQRKLLYLIGSQVIVGGIILLIW
jgi:4-amino-4-deoxy-L-arabinose transferase-like glycosyltransferase